MRNVLKTTCIALACTFVLAGAARADTQRIDVPAGDLITALEALAKQADVDLVYQDEQVKGLRTGGVSGNLSAREAVAKLLQGTPLSIRMDEASGAILITPTRKEDAGSPSADSAQSLSQVSGETSSGAADKKSLWERMRLAQASSSSSDGTTAAAAQSTDANADDKDAKVQEIIVTARKREERIQDIPISIAVVTRDDIERRGLVSAEDYLRGIPGVNQVDGAVSGQSIVIRGMETSLVNQNFASGPTTATYFGETPTTTVGGLGLSTNIDLKLVDIERVEVLRGPQGTAFGNSSMGGAVRTIPVAPRLDRAEGKVGAGYSSTSGSGSDNYNIQAVGNLPLVKDKLAIRVTAFAFSDGGYYRNRAGSNAAFQSQIAAYGAQAFAADEDGVGESYTDGGRIAALFQPTDALKVTLSYLKQKTEVDGMPVATIGTYDQAVLQVAPEHVRRGEKAGVSDMDIGIANAVVEYDFGWASLLATYSHIDSSSLLAQPDQLFGRATVRSFLADSDHSEQVGEIRLATKLNGNWQFLAGLYAEDIDDDTLFDYIWYGDPATVNLPCCVGVRNLGDYFDVRNLKQKAAFGEVSWQFLPGFTLTGGVRAYDYDRKVGTATSGPLFGGVRVTDDKGDASGSTFRANLSYKPNDGMLLYAGWAQGFRLGKPQPGLPQGLCDPNNDGIVDGTNISLESAKRVNSDDVDSYELGGKFVTLGRRLMIDVAVFRMDWSGLPVRVVAGVLPTSCGLTYVTNAGGAVSEGGEFQASLRATNALRIDFGGSYVHAELTDSVPAQGFLDGDRLPGTPEVNANLGTQYDFAIGGHSAFVRADAIYVGSFFGDVRNSRILNTEAGDYVKLDATARVAFDKLNIDLYVRNLTNEDAYTFRGAANYGAFYGYRLRPRTFGLQLGYNF